MTTRTPQEVYNDLLAAGFTPAAAVTMTEIAGAESNYNDAAVGDVGLENNTWGPSYGLFQIRTQKSATGSGADRDISALAGDPAAQAAAAYQISNGGTNFAAWTTYTSGKYQQFAAAVKKALGSTAPPATSTATVAAGGGGGPFPVIGPGWLPWNWASDAGNAAAQTAQAEFSSARTIVVETLFGGLGLALVGLGIVGLSQNKIIGFRRKADKAAGSVAAAFI